MMSNRQVELPTFIPQLKRKCFPPHDKNNSKLLSLNEKLELILSMNLHNRPTLILPSSSTLLTWDVSLPAWLRRPWGRPEASVGGGRRWCWESCAGWSGGLGTTLRHSWHSYEGQSSHARWSRPIAQAALFPKRSYTQQFPSFCIRKRSFIRSIFFMSNASLWFNFHLFSEYIMFNQIQLYNIITKLWLLHEFSSALLNYHST